MSRFRLSPIRRALSKERLSSGFALRRLLARLRSGRSRAGVLKRPQIVPREYTGKWLAWTPDGLRILAAADTAVEARAEAIRLGQPDAIFEWIPPAEELRPTPRPGARA